MKKRILIVDDELQIRNLLKLILEKEGYFIDTACNGVQGLKKLTTDNFDLLITDLIMPEKEGIETIIEVKKLYPEIKIIAISGGGKFAATDFLKTAKLLGANKVMQKPFEFDDVISSVEEVMAE